MKVSSQRARFNGIIVISFAVLFSFSSCIGVKKLKYFQDLPDSARVFLPPILKQERVIEYGDQINIVISAEDKEAVAYFNNPGSGTAGFTVNTLGYIEFPIIGKQKVLGLTERQLKESLTEVVGKYVKNPMIDVRFTSFKIIVLGEVGSPGTYVMDMQRTNIFQALALAGDLPITAKRKGIQLFRDYNGERSVMKFDLRDKDVLLNPEIFELRHNDVIYVQAFGTKYFKENFGFISSIVGGVFGLVSIAYLVLDNNR